ncbi:MAG: VWA domain-containing protein, partial [Planctomycetes bacterium]|nr:VWA domain-containing protein [Planctomycetota bacterium]
RVPGTMLVISDGEADPSALASAESAASRGVRIHLRRLARPPADDLAVASLDLPGEVAPHDPFQFAGWISCDSAMEADLVLTRDGEEIARAPRRFDPGLHRVAFRDLLAGAGIHVYELAVRDPAGGPDANAANNRARAVTRVRAQPRILVVNHDGATGVLARTLLDAGLAVDVAAGPEAPSSPADLDPYRAVVLENVSATVLGPDRLALLRTYIENLGGGVLVTGGKRSFGVGGYFRSVLEEALPVSMELRQEQRKLALALAIALDRSGSMGAPVAGGKIKMDLANAGTCAAIETLGPLDEAAVIAVDSSVHVVVPMGPVTDKGGILGDVERISVGGGGIFTDAALKAAGEELDHTALATRHIILFADAADAEEPGDYVNRCKKFLDHGITVSVVGLGSPSDPDAAFLRDVALRGEGRIEFTSDPTDLPRLFAQEAITVSRSAFVPDPAPCAILPDIALMGAPPALQPPPVGGYNLAYLRPLATAGILTADDTAAPILAFWHRGLGRSAALTCEVDGEFSGAWGTWGDRDAVLVTAARWIAGGIPPTGIAARVTIEGGTARIEVSLDETFAASLVETPRWWIVPPDPRAEPVAVPLSWTGERTLAGRFRLPGTGTYLSVVRWGENRYIHAPPVTLSYSPEAAPRRGLPSGELLLRQIGDLTGGREILNVEDLFRDRALRSTARSLQGPLLIAAIVLLTLEIAQRRLALTQLLPSMRFRRLLPRRARRATAAPLPGAGTLPAGAPSPAPGSPAPTQGQPPTAPPATEPSAFAKAKARAQRRTEA